jgi:hypothetical protein
MILILNPGDGHDVETFDTIDSALSRRAFWLDRKTLPRLYAFHENRRLFQQWVEGCWYDEERSRLPIKVLQVDKNARPFGR